MTIRHKSWLSERFIFVLNKKNLASDQSADLYCQLRTSLEHDHIRDMIHRLHSSILSVWKLSMWYTLHPSIYVHLQMSKKAKCFFFELKWASFNYKMITFRITICQKTISYLYMSIFLSKMSMNVCQVYTAACQVLFLYFYNN